MTFGKLFYGFFYLLYSLCFLEYVWMKYMINGIQQYIGGDYINNNNDDDDDSCVMMEMVMMMIIMNHNRSHQGDHAPHASASSIHLD